jgi:hypothetical protein
MSRPAWFFAWCAACVIAASGGLPASGQQDQPSTTTTHRKLAPGVLKSVSPQRQIQESFSRHDITELLAVEPADVPFDWARNVDYRHDVWTLQFRFKPVRMMRVDIPQPGGIMQNKLIWYMVYSVTNRRIEEKVVEVQSLADRNAESLPEFGWMHPVPAGGGLYRVQFVNRPIRFVPRFLLEGHESLAEETGYTKVYSDRVIPVALRQIAQREDPTRRFFNSAEISQGYLAVGKTAWGIATWEDVDPRIDRFSVYVKGLTNAYTWRDDPQRYTADAPLEAYRRMSVKTLKLNFWRPGDEVAEHEREIRYGVPGGVDYDWLYVVETGVTQ